MAGDAGRLAIPFEYAFKGEADLSLPAATIGVGQKSDTASTGLQSVDHNLGYLPTIQVFLTNNAEDTFVPVTNSVYDMGATFQFDAGGFLTVSQMYRIQLYFYVDKEKFYLFATQTLDGLEGMTLPSIDFHFVFFLGSQALV